MVAGTYAHHDTRSDNIVETFEESHGSFETALGVDGVVENILSLLRAGVRQHGSEKLGDGDREQWLVDA
jgi:hypothetical protein